MMPSTPADSMNQNSQVDENMNNVSDEASSIPLQAGDLGGTVSQAEAGNHHGGILESNQVYLIEDSSCELIKLFSELPPEMAQYALKFLDYNSCLRMRRTCKYFLGQVNTHLKESTPKRTPESYVVISVDPANVNKNLSAFMQQVELPVSHVYLSATDKQQHQNFFKDPLLVEFLKQRGPEITHLKMTFMEIPICADISVPFYEAFTKLESFQCDGAYIQPREQRKAQIPLVPESFRNLKRFVVFVGRTRSSTNEEDEKFCEFYRSLNDITDLEEFGYMPDYGEETVFECILQRLQSNQKNLKSLILASQDVPLKKELLQVCHAAGVTVKQASACCLEGLPLTAIQGTVASLRSVYSDAWFTVEFPRVVKAFLTTNYDETTNWENAELTQWPALRSLKLWLIRSIHCIIDNSYRERTRRLFQFIFENGPRPALEDLSLKYFLNHDLVCLPNPEILTGTCSNLKYLTLLGCIGNNVFFNALWRGLPLLEHVEISECPNFGDAGLIGLSCEKNDEPLLASLKHLKCLEITGLSKMRHVTSALLERGIRHLPLRFLRLACTLVHRDVDEEVIMPSSASRFHAVKPPMRQYDTVPIATISLAAVESLKTGKLAETIEKLDLSRLYLHDNGYTVNMQCLEPEFRSFNMI